MNMIKPTIRCFLWAVCLIPLLLANSHAANGSGGAGPDAAQMPHNSIESVSHTVLQGGKLLVTLKLKYALKKSPAGFAVNNPPRIALDFLDTTNALGKSNVEVGDGVLRNLNIVQAGSRTRLVLNLAKPAGYETRIAGDTVLITLQGTEAPGVTSNVSAKFAEVTPGAQKHALRDIDFHRGKNGEGQVVVDLSDTNTGIDIHTEGKSIVVEFINATLPRNLERKLDVVDFGTPVQTVTTLAHGNNARMVVEPKGLWEHSAYQADHQFILDIKPIIEDPNKLVQGSKTGYKGEKLSLDFQNIETRTLLAVLADFAEMNIVVSDSIKSSTTLRLKDVPWDQALDIVLKQAGLSMRKSGNVIMIAPSEELATKEKLELEATQQISELELVQTESFQMKYQKAADVQKILSDKTQQILSKRGSVVVDPRTNTLFVQDTPSKLGEIRKFIGQIDVAVKQVMIESRIVEATDSFSKDLGVRLGIQDRRNVGSGSLLGTSGNLTDSSALALGAVPAGGIGNLNVNLPVTGGGAVAFTLLNKATGNLINLELSAMQADGKGKIISNPRVLTANQMEATIASGTKIPYLQASSSGATTVAFIDAVLKLKVKPQITPDDNIIMDINVKKDEPDWTHIVNGTPGVTTKEVNSQVLVENGGTVVIGGIYTQTQTDTVAKVPLLGDIPVLGNLFKTRSNVDNKNELLIFVTPRIIQDSLNLR